MFSVPTLEELNLGVTIPALSLAIGTCILLLVDLFIPKNRKVITMWLALAGLAFSFIANLLVYNAPQTGALFGAFIADPFTGFINMTVLLTTALAILMSADYLKRTGIHRGEYYALVLFSASGAMTMASANDLVSVFVALELLSIPLYVLAAFRQPDVKSEESGLKYFILGAFASAFFVYGAALIYGATGTTSIPEIFGAVQRIVAENSNLSYFLLLGSALALVGLGFKIAVVPFHMWTPDVYEGAPTPVTAFMSVGAKLGGFAALLRVFAVGLPTFTMDGGTIAAWQTTIWVVAAATLLLGNIVAIAQTNVKRMLAYSSIAHAGYILMAVAAAGTQGVTDYAVRGALVYLLAYMFTNLGAFAIAIALEKDDGSGTSIEAFVGLGKSRPALAAMMTVFMLSLTGIPLTGGFIGKLLVFDATLRADLVPLAIIGVLTSVVSAFYYVRIIVNMYLREGDGDPAEGATPYLRWAAYVALAGTLLMGVLPWLAINMTNGVTFAAALLP